MLKKLISIVFILTSLAGAIFILPRLHYNLIRQSVGARVVYLVNKEGNSGGTGVHIKASSGKTYVLTNDHVCGLATPEGIIYGRDSDMSPVDPSIPMKVLAHSEYSDLCLVEALRPNMSGLSIGKEPEPGDMISVIGHPSLFPLTVTQGEIIGAFRTKILMFLIDKSNQNMCNLPKYTQEKAMIFGMFEIDVCVLNIVGNISTAISLPGSSGSPVVDFWGDIVGLVFAGTNDSHWGIFIRVEDIKEFLKKY